jgi:hypothetical protein
MANPVEEKSMVGKLLMRVKQARAVSHDQEIAALYKRNHATPGTPGYKLAETQAVKANGKEVVEYRLYKLIDCSVVTMDAEITTHVETGLNSIHERSR